MKLLTIILLLICPTIVFATKMDITVNRDNEWFHVHDSLSASSVDFKSTEEVIEFIKHKDDNEAIENLRQICSYLLDQDPTFSWNFSHKIFNITPLTVSEEL